MKKQKIALLSLLLITLTACQKMAELGQDPQFVRSMQQLQQAGAIAQQQQMYQQQQMQMNKPTFCQPWGNGMMCQ